MPEPPSDESQAMTVDAEVMPRSDDEGMGSDEEMGSDEVEARRLVPHHETVAQQEHAMQQSLAAQEQRAESLALTPKAAGKAAAAAEGVARRATDEAPDPNPAEEQQDEEEGQGKGAHSSQVGSLAGSSTEARGARDLPPEIATKLAAIDGVLSPSVTLSPPPSLPASLLLCPRPTRTLAWRRSSSGRKCAKKKPSSCSSRKRTKAAWWRCLSVWCQPFFTRSLGKPRSMSATTRWTALRRRPCA